LNGTFETTLGGFTLVNGAQPNEWFVGTALGNGPTPPGANMTYVLSNTTGPTHGYNVNPSTMAHLYRDVVLPAGQNQFQLAFDWKG